MDETVAYIFLVLVKVLDTLYALFRKGFVFTTSVRKSFQINFFIFYFLG